MRILHTADWHLGCTLEGRSRLDEQAAFLAELCTLADDERVDLVLVAGDIYDAANPPAAAEELYCDALARLAAGGRRSVVVIAGNHDSPDRLTAVRGLAARLGIVIFGYPHDHPAAVATGATAGCRVVAGGPGWVEVAVPGCDHPAVILALAYPSEARLGEVLRRTLAEEDLQRAYSDRIGALFAAQAAHFRPDTVRLAVSHLFVAGGLESDSERPIQVGGSYTVAPAALPGSAQYVALGHLHRPQRVHGAPALTRYAGSPLAYSFSEAGQAKSVTLLALVPGEAAPVSVREVPLSAGRSLVRWQARDGLPQVYRWCEEGRDRTAWVDLELHVAAPLTMDEIQALRRLHPGLVHIRPVFPAMETAATAEVRAHLTLAEQFQRFFAQRTGGGEAPEPLLRLFLELAAAPGDGGTGEGGGEPGDEDADSHGDGDTAPGDGAGGRGAGA